MEYRPGLLPVFILAAAVLSIGCGGDRYQEIVFKAPFGRLPSGIASGFDDLEPGDSAEIRLEGEWFDPPLELSVIAREDADLSSPLSASEAAYSAFKTNDGDWILASFSEWDRNDIAGFLADPEVSAGSQRYFEQIRQKVVHGWATYLRDSTDYRLVFVRLTNGATTQRVETFVQEDGEWRRTNQLGRDTTFHVVWNAFRHGSVTAQ